MHLAFIETRSQAGISAPPVTVEVHLSAGLPAFQVVGVTDAASREIRSRVRSAIVSSHLKWPDFNITINLAPTEQVKQGARFDLPIAIGLLVASNQLPREAIENREFLGELSLDGSLRPSHGALSATLSATDASHTLCVAPDGAAQLASVPGSRILAATDLLSLCAALRAREPALVKPGSDPLAPTPNYPDLSQLRGQPFLCRALELAAAGGHHLLMCGPPGSRQNTGRVGFTGASPPAPTQDTAADLADSRFDGAAASQWTHLQSAAPLKQYCCADRWHGQSDSRRNLYGTWRGLIS